MRFLFAFKLFLKTTIVVAHRNDGLGAGISKETRLTRRTGKTEKNMQACLLNKKRKKLKPMILSCVEAFESVNLD